MPDIPLTYEPAVVAQRLLPALTAAASQGHRFFIDWFEDFTRYAWARRTHMRNLSIPVEPKEGRGGWAKFRGGGTRLQGDRRKMYHVYREILLGLSVIATVDPPDRRRRLSGTWSVDLPVPSGGERGWSEAWRVAREMLATADPVGPVPLDEVRRHVRRCKPHVRKDIRRRPEKHAQLEHSLVNRHLLEQLRAGVLLSPAKANPQCLVVARWPRGDEFESADAAVFETAAAADPVAVVKCGLGNAGEQEMADFIELTRQLRSRCSSFLYFALREPEPDLLRAADAEGIEVMQVLPRRAAAAKLRA